MNRLGLTRVAYGCQSIAEIIAREQHLLDEQARFVRLTTARTPRRDLAGGSLFWIVRHVLVARQPICDVVECASAEGQPRTEIRLTPGVIPVVPRHCRSHQGWRYLVEADWPPDDAGTPIPADMLAELAGLSLL